MNKKIIYFKMVIILIISIGLILCINGCGTNSEEREVDSNKNNNEQKSDSQEELYLSIDAEQKGEKIEVKGDTSLVDGALILVSLYDNTDNLIAQDKPVVQKGKFSTKLGSQDEFIDGVYTITATFTCIGQDEELQAKYGEKGEKLKNFNIVEGILNEGSITTLESRTEVKVTGTQSAEESVNKAKELLLDTEKIYADLNDMYKKQKGDFNTAEWAEFSSSFRDRVEELEAEVEKAQLNRSIKSNLNMGLGYIQQLHGEYNKELQGRGQPEIKKDMKGFVEEHIDKVQEEIKKITS